MTRRLAAAGHWVMWRPDKAQSTGNHDCPGNGLGESGRELVARVT